MALKTVNLSIALAQGLDTKTDPKRVLPGKLLSLENGVFETPGKISKRPGYKGLSNLDQFGGAIAYPEGLTKFRNELVLVANNQLYSYQEQNDRFQPKGSLFTVKNKSKNAVNSYSSKQTPDYSQNGGIGVIVWEDTVPTNQVSLSVIELSSGSLLQNQQVMNTSAVLPRVVSLLGYVFIFYKALSNQIILRRLDIRTPSALPNSSQLPEQIVVSDASTTNHMFDVVSTGDEVALSYVNTAGNITTAYILNDGTIGGAATNYPAPVTLITFTIFHLALAYEPTSERILISYVASSGTQGGQTSLTYIAYNRVLTTYIGPVQAELPAFLTTLRSAPYFDGPLNFGIFLEKGTTSGQNSDHNISIVTGVLSQGTFTGPSVLQRSAGLASRVFAVEGQYFVMIVHDTPLQASFFTLSQAGAIASKFSVTTAAGIPIRYAVPSVFVDSSGNATYPALNKFRFTTQSEAVSYTNGITLETLSFKPSQGVESAVIGDNLLLATGIVSQYDGNSIVEQGFHVYPEINNASLALSSSTAGGIGAGTFYYFAVYAWVDSSGNMHRSGPSLQATITTTSGTNTVAITVPTLRLTLKKNVTIEIYRTTAAGGAIPYLVTTYPAPSADVSDNTIDYVTIQDATPDASLLANPALYTTGGVLPNLPTPSASIVEVNNNRALLAGCSDPLTFYYSKESRGGFGLGFNGNLSVRMDPRGGDITGVKYMDSNIVIFKKNLIFFIAGDGPNDLGQGSDYSAPQLVTSDVGAVSSKSIQLTPSGLIFQSLKGIYLLTRDFQLSYIGAEVERYNDLTITSATTLPNKNQIIFTTSGDIALSYDYFVRQWSVFTNHGGLDSVNWKDSSYCYLRRDGTVYRQDQTRFDDNDSAYSLLIKTGWIKLSGLQNYQRVRTLTILGDYYSSHELQIEAAYDYSPLFTSQYLFYPDTIYGSSYGSGTYGADQVYGGRSASAYQYKAHLDRQKCEAVQFQFKDIQTNGPGAAYSLSDLNLEIGIKPGAVRLGAFQRGGSV